MISVINISMPPSCRYMSDYDKLINGLLPINGKFILNKTLTGCGGTSLFLNSGLMVVIISPRIQVLKINTNSILIVFCFIFLNVMTDKVL